MFELAFWNISIHIRARRHEQQQPKKKMYGLIVILISFQSSNTLLSELFCVYFHLNSQLSKTQSEQNRTYSNMSCLFRSLSAFVSGMSTQTLRNYICDYMLSNPKLYGEDDARLFDILKWQGHRYHMNYIEEMRHPDTWGSAIEIACFVNMFYCRVVVIFAENGSECEFIPRLSIDQQTGAVKPLQGTATIYYTGNHYEPVLNRAS